MMKMVFLSLSMLTLFIACSGTDDCENDAMKLTRFEKGINYCLNDELSFTMEDLKDSRCPTQVMCVWAGEVVIDVQFDGSTVQDTSFTYQKNIQEKFTYQGYEFVIDSITPFPVVPIENTALTVHMHVVK
ncbi:MAG: hypothetical protein IPL23_12565 [Saprospiraceae bacterium]|nr:hypothetical protein [Saprospiraceae bacterium]